MEVFQNEFSGQNHGELSWSDAFSKALKPASVILSQRTNLASEVRDNVLTYLRSQQFLGIGYEAPRKLEDTPKLLPSEFWDGLVNWDRSSLTFQCLSFVDVRIVVPVWIDKTPSECGSIERTRGRPSVASDLERCFQTLAAEQRFDLNGSMKSNFFIIRDWLKEHLFADGTKEYKISNEGIRKQSSPYFNMLKDELKQSFKKP